VLIQEYKPQKFKMSYLDDCSELENDQTIQKNAGVRTDNCMHLIIGMAVGVAFIVIPNVLKLIVWS
jgi:hypothetical protein